MQQEYIENVNKSIDAMVNHLKSSGMSDEYIGYYLNQAAGRAAVYAEDIEKGAMHLNKGFENWTPSK